MSRSINVVVLASEIRLLSQLWYERVSLFSNRGRLLSRYPLASRTPKAPLTLCSAWVYVGIFVTTPLLSMARPQFLQDCQMLGSGKYPFVYLYTKVPSVQHLTGDVRVKLCTPHWALRPKTRYRRYQSSFGPYGLLRVLIVGYRR